MRWLPAAIGLAACGFPHGKLPDDGGTTSDDVPIDIRDIDAPVDAAVLGAWGTPALSFAALTDDDPTATADVLELYFNRAGDIYKTTRTAVNSGWAGPTLVTELSTGAIETTPEITSDGLVMYFSSNRAGSDANSYDIWMSTRASRNDVWGMPVNVDELSTNGDENASAPTDDNLAIVWNDENPEDIWYSTRASTTVSWNAPAFLTSVNTSGRELGPMLSQNKRTIYFGSSRGSGEELYEAKRTTLTDSFGMAMPITELNSASTEGDPWVSPDERHIFFTSNRSGSFGIYEASR